MMRHDVKIPFNNLAAAYSCDQAAIEKAVVRVLRSGRYLHGVEVAAFEREFADWCGTRYAIAVASGTEAIYLALRALAVGPGDEVITVSFTCVATVAAICLTGARVVYADIRESDWTIDLADLRRKITRRTKAIVPVHVYGCPAAMDEIMALARKHKLRVVEDACQAHGAAIHGRRVGTFADAGAFSFYPTKNLAACGDAGAIVTHSATLAHRLRSLRDYGRCPDRGFAAPGINSRMDEVQAAILRVGLHRFARKQHARDQVAAWYHAALADSGISRQQPAPGNVHAYHQFAVLVPQRNIFRSHLAARGIVTKVHYPYCLHRDRVYGVPGCRLPVTEHVGRRVVSLPAGPCLTRTAVQAICEAVLGGDEPKNGSANGNRTRVSAVRGQRPNR